MKKRLAVLVTVTITTGVLSTSMASAFGMGRVNWGLTAFVEDKEKEILEAEENEEWIWDDTEEDAEWIWDDAEEDTEWVWNEAEETRKNSKLVWEVLSEEQNEMILIGWEGDKVDWRKKYSEKELSDIRAACVPNTVAKVKSIPAKGVPSLILHTNLCGIRLVPAKTDEFTISYLGVKNADDFPIQTAVETNGALSITVEGKMETLHYISQTEGKLVNLVQIEVPARLLQKITIQDKTGNILVSELPVELKASTVSGTMIAVGDTLKNTMQMESVNGTVAVAGKKVTGAVNLTTVNGECIVKGDTIQGKISQECVNGDIIVSAKEVETAKLNCVNGDIHASIEKITKTVDASTVNGDIFVELLQKPENFTFRPDVKWLTHLEVPSGWKKGFTIGNGSAKLIVSSLNGDVTIEVAGS